MNDEWEGLNEVGLRAWRDASDCSYSPQTAQPAGRQRLKCVVGSLSGPVTPGVWAGSGWANPDSDTLFSPDPRTWWVLWSLRRMCTPVAPGVTSKDQMQFLFVQYTMHSFTLSSLITITLRIQKLTASTEKPYQCAQPAVLTVGSLSKYFQCWIHSLYVIPQKNEFVFEMNTHENTLYCTQWIESLISQ